MWYWSPSFCMLTQSLWGFRSITMSNKYLGETYLWELQVGQLVGLHHLKISWILLYWQAKSLVSVTPQNHKPFSLLLFPSFTESSLLQLYSVAKIALKCRLDTLKLLKKKKGIKLIGGVNWRVVDNFVVCLSSKKYSGRSRIGRYYSEVSVSHCDSWWLKLSFIFMF